VTKYASYGQRHEKPIRKDRVAIAALFILAVILVPIVLRSSCTRRDEPLTIVDDGGNAVDGLTAVGPDDSIDSVIDDILDSGSDGVDDGTVTAELPAGILSHVVEDGETMAEVAAALGVRIEVLRASNRLYGSEALQPGEVLYASPDGVLHLIKSGQTLTHIALSYAVPLETILAANGIDAADTIYAGDRIVIPNVTSTFWDNVVVLSKGIPSRFIWPLVGEVLSGFGTRTHPVYGEVHHHDGIDIDVPEGTGVFASAGGVVYFVGEQPGYGNVVFLQHTDGFVTIYGHLSRSFVQVGQYVEAGQEIALSGNTGISSGPHLHFEIRNNEFPVDPIRYLP